jgi:putative ABC transport system permease protein
MTSAALAFGLRAAWARRRRTLPFVIVIAIGVGIVAATAGMAGRANAAAKQTAEEENAGRVVDVDVDEITGGSAARLTTATLARIRDLAGVRVVLPASTVPLGVKDAEIPGVLLTGSTLQTSRPPMVQPQGPLRRPGPGEVLVPASAQGSRLGRLIGREVDFATQRATGPGHGVGDQYRLRVIGTYDPSYQVNGRDVAYLALPDIERLAAGLSGVGVTRFRRRIGFDSAQVVATDAAAVPHILAAVQALGLSATTLAQQFEELPTVLALARLLGEVLGVLLLLVILATATSQTALSVRSRWTEIGVLRSVGYGRGDAMLAFAIEAIAATLVGVALGVLLSLPLSLLLVKLIGRDSAVQAHLTGSSLPAAGPVALFALLTLLAGCAGALLAARRAARLDPSTVLRTP